MATDPKLKVDRLLQRTAWIIGILVGLTVLFTFLQPYLPDIAKYLANTFFPNYLYPFLDWFSLLILPVLSLFTAALVILLWFKTTWPLVRWQVRAVCGASLVVCLVVFVRNEANAITSIVWLPPLLTWSFIGILAIKQNGDFNRICLGVMRELNEVLVESAESLGTKSNQARLLELKGRIQALLDRLPELKEPYGPPPGNRPV